MDYFFQVISNSRFLIYLWPGPEPLGRLADDLGLRLRGMNRKPNHPPLLAIASVGLGRLRSFVLHCTTKLATAAFPGAIVGFCTAAPTVTCAGPAGAE